MTRPHLSTECVAFVLTWVITLTAWKVLRIEEKWTTRLRPATDEVA